MKRAPVVAALLSVIAAQLPAQRADTSLYTPSRELRFGISNSAVKRAVSYPGSSVSFANANLRGLEVMTMGAHGGAIRVRYETGSMGQNTFPAGGKLENLVGDLLMGSHEFALLVGYRLTKLDWNGERQFHMPQAGFEGGKHFGGAGLLVKAAITYRRTLGEDKADSMNTAGLEGRTSVLYVPPRMPVYLELGYRREVLDYRNAADAIARRDEVSAVILSIGLQTGLTVR